MVFSDLLQDEEYSLGQFLIYKREIGENVVFIEHLEVREDVVVLMIGGYVIVVSIKEWSEEKEKGVDDFVLVFQKEGFE